MTVLVAGTLVRDGVADGTTAVLVGVEVDGTLVRVGVFVAFGVKVG